MIMLYDMEDNIVTCFENAKECAAWFETNVKCIYSHISRLRKGLISKKLNKQNHQWYKLYKVE